MVPYDHEGVALDLCQRCHGIWFDCGEIKKVEDVRIELVPVKGSNAPELPCPRCPGQLSEGKLPRSGGLLLDECDRCRGVFLDAGELRRLQRYKVTAREAAAAEDARVLRDFAETKRRDQQRGTITDDNIEVESAWATNRNLVSYLLDLPVEEDSSHERTPFALLGLIGLIAAIWLWQLSATQAVWMRLAAVPSEISAGRHLYALLTAAFIHGGWFHVLGNLYFLWTFGDNVEDRLGSWAFLAWYVAWALAGSVAFVIMASPARQGVPGLGASGAISGVMGAYTVLFPRRRIIVPLGGFLAWGYVWRVPVWGYLGFWAGFQLFAAALRLPGVGWWAHLGGFAAGALVGAGYRAAEADRSA